MATTRSSRAAKIYLLLLLSLLTALNYYDRYVISILVEDIKHEFTLSDSQIGILSGLAFAVIYSVAAVPIARFADGGRHARVLGLSALVWSLMTGACGMATGFWTFLLARFGVGLGESGGAPTTQALIARRFSARWRGTAFGIIGLAGATGSFAALGGGGAIAHAHGWRAAFYPGAIAGIVLALVLLLTVRDERTPSGISSPAMPLGEAMRILVRRRAYVWTCGGLSLASLGAYGALAWMPAYLMREFGLNSQQVGATYSVSVGIATLVGTLVGGVIGDWLTRRDVRAPFYLLAVSFGLAAPMAMTMLLSKTYGTALALTFPQVIVSMIWVAPAYAAIQALSGRRLGATGAAVFMMFINLIGQGLGPLAVGWLSDVLVPSLGKESLRYALVIGICPYFLGVIAFLFAARTARQDIADANAD